VTWSRFIGGPRVFALVGCLLDVCGPLIIPAILATKSAPNYMVEYGNQICSDISDASLDHNGKIEQSTATLFGAKLADLIFFNRILLTLPPPLNLDIHSGIERSAFDFATRAISIITSPIIHQSNRTELAPVTKILHA
jgi:hypothetical protein